MILDAGSSSNLDITSAEELDQLVIMPRAAKLALALADVHQPVFDAARIGVLATAFDTVGHAVDALAQ